MNLPRPSRSFVALSAGLAIAAGNLQAGNLQAPSLASSSEAPAHVRDASREKPSHEAVGGEKSVISSPVLRPHCDGETALASPPVEHQEVSDVKEVVTGRFCVVPPRSPRGWGSPPAMVSAPPAASH